MRIFPSLPIGLVYLCLLMPALAQEPPGANSEQNTSGSSGNSMPDGPRLPSSIPPDYTLDSGDRVQIDLSTSSEQTVVQRIDHNGNVSLYPAGPIRLRGLNSEQARRKIEKAMRTYFHHPVVSLRLVQLRTFYVTISGTIPKPGRYLVDGLTGVCDLVQTAGGPGSQGRTRSIEVRDPGQPPKRFVDYLSWSRSGKIQENPKLHAGEVVYVGPRLQEVYISGPVAYPGVYEALPGENFSHFIQYAAGGFLQNADLTSIQVGRTNLANQRDRIQLDASTPEFTENVRAGDQIQVLDRMVNQDRIVVLGEVTNPSPPAIDPKASTPSTAADSARARVATRFNYRIRQGDRVSDVLKALGGPTVLANLARARIQRKNSLGKTENLDFNLGLAMRQPGSENDLVLQNEDTLIVPPVPDSVYVIGQVVTPGAMPYKPGAGMREYLALAGGPTALGLPKAGRLIRIKDHPENPSIYEVNLEDYLQEKNHPNLVMEAGDILYVPREGETFLRQAASVGSLLAPILFLLK